jgi:hypothetical protein
MFYRKGIEPLLSIVKGKLQRADPIVPSLFRAKPLNNDNRNLKLETVRWGLFLQPDLCLHEFREHVDYSQLANQRLGGTGLLGRSQ